MRIQKHFRNPLKKSERKSSTSRSRARKMVRKRVVSCKRNSSKPRQEVISDKLEALKCLIPRDIGSGSDAVVKVEQLFQETADYIIVLKTQAFVLQKLVEFYDNNGTHDDESKNEKQHQIVQEDQS